jgi:hypothetical protein
VERSKPIPLDMLIRPDAEILREAIQASGRSQRKFASHVIGRDLSTVGRWLRGAPMPGVVKSLCCRIIMEAEP